METIKTRFEAKFLMRDISNNKVTNQVVTLGTDIEAFIAQELTLLVELVEKTRRSKDAEGIAPNDDAVGSENRAFGYNACVDNVAAIIRARAKELI